LWQAANDDVDFGQHFWKSRIHAVSLFAGLFPEFQSLFGQQLALRKASAGVKKSERDPRLAFSSLNTFLVNATPTTLAVNKRFTFISTGERDAEETSE
jgi:hypothetical protein